MFRLRVRILLVFFLLVTSVLVMRLVYLQILMNKSYSKEVRSKNIFEERIEPLRGSIIDTRGVKLAEEVPSFNLYLDPLKVPFVDMRFIKELKEYQKIAIKMNRDNRKNVEKNFIARLPVEVGLLMKDPIIVKLREVISVEEKEFQEELINVFEFSVKRWALEPLFYNLKYDQAILVEIDFKDVNGIKIESQTIRAYPMGQSLAHILGQVQYLQDYEVDELISQGKLYNRSHLLVDLTNEEHQYLLGRHELSKTWVGRLGIEYVFNQSLRGVSGEKCTEKILSKNSDGEVLPEYKIHYEIPPKIGKDIQLTIDIDLQKIVEKVMREPFVSTVNGQQVTRQNVGSFVAINPNNGEILAMVSTPDFDPNDLIPPIDKNVLKDVILGMGKPNYHKAINRAIRARYPPGSPFKVFVALMGLEAGIIDEHTEVFCEGAIRFPNGKEYKCHARYGHQMVDVNKAIKKSCNVFFYHLGMKLGTKNQVDWCHKFGFGLKTGVELPDEYEGNLPNVRLDSSGREIPNKYIDSHFSIGQVTLEVTPLQMARAVSVFANKGKLVTPHLVKTDYEKLKTVDLKFSAKNIEIVEQGMYDVVNVIGGTASRSKIDDFTMVGKTGTADLDGRPSSKNPKWNDPLYRFSEKSYLPHAWFVGYAPREKPEIAFACVSEHSGHGGEIAAPIVKKILEEYLKLKQKREEEEPKG